MIITNIEPDSLIESIYKYLETTSLEEKPRAYIGASSIGEDCERKLYYKLRYPEQAKPRHAELILAANDGFHSENYIASLIREIPGIKLTTHDILGKQLGFVDDIFAGHIDGIIEGLPQAPKTPHIWENKCCNEKKYTALLNLKEKHGTKLTLEKWNYTYYCQAVIYMHYFDLTRHYMTIALAGSRKITSLRTKANPKLAKFLIEKAKRIGNATSAPIGISENPAWYLCKMCEFNQFCHK